MQKDKKPKDIIYQKVLSKIILSSSMEETTINSDMKRY